MAVGTTMAVIGLASAAAQAYGAHRASSAANKAAKQQEQGAAKAAEVARGVYGTQMGLMEPYAALGRQNANTLGRLMQPGVPYPAQMQAADAGRFQQTPPPWMMGPPQGGPAMPRGGTLGGMMPPGMLPPFAQPPMGGLGRMMPPQPVMGGRRPHALGRLMPRAA
jgi:hypothetical protein